MTRYEEVMQAMLARLQGSPAICGNVRRSHKIPVTRADCPAVYLAEGNDKPVGSVTGCNEDREAYPRVRVFVHEDDGYATADALVLDAVARLNPEATDQTPYPYAVTVYLDEITVDEENADGDVLRKDLNLRICYKAGVWTLGAPINA